MIEIKGDLFEYALNPSNGCEAIAITTNGCWFGAGITAKAIMGAGIAKQARDRFPVIQTTLARLLSSNYKFHTDVSDGEIYEEEPWNIPYLLLKDPLCIFSFPTKRTHIFAEKDRSNIVFKYKKEVQYGAPLPGWKGRSDLTLIRRSATMLTVLVEYAKISCIAIPRPGCKNGELSWKKTVKPVLEELFDDKYVIVDHAS
jgi:hypothetical protein